MRDPRLRVAAALFVPLVVGLSACGSDDTAEPPKAEATSEPTSEPSSEPTSGATVVPTTEDTGAPQGGAAGAPKDADFDAYCDLYYSQLGQVNGETYTADYFHAGAAAAMKLGTPAEMSEIARMGFELYVEGIAEVDEADAALLSEPNAGLVYAQVFGIGDTDAALIIPWISNSNIACQDGEAAALAG